MDPVTRSVITRSVLINSIIMEVYIRSELPLPDAIADQVRFDVVICTAAVHAQDLVWQVPALLL